MTHEHHITVEMEIISPEPTGSPEPNQPEEVAVW